MLALLCVLFRKAGWLKRLSYEDAARMIGKHFPEIDDKLLNTLQLHELAEQNPEGYSLLDAAIERRIEQMKPFTFRQILFPLPGTAYYSICPPQSYK